MSKEKEEKKVLFVYVCVISKMMVNAKPKFLIANEIEEE
jgi:hypothetical protein